MSGRERGAAIAAVVILDALFGCCFDGDTPVLTPDRGPVPIRSLAAGDIVMSWDERTGKAVPAKVMARTQSIVTDDAILRLSGDCAVHMTPNHPVFVAGRGFVPAAKLRTGARCRLLSRGTAAVLYVELRARPPHTVFNLLLRGSHSFFVGTRHLLVHDASGCVALRAAPGHSRPFEPMRRRR